MTSTGLHFSDEDNHLVNIGIDYDLSTIPSPVQEKHAGEQVVEPGLLPLEESKFNSWEPISAHGVMYSDNDASYRYAAIMQP